jgi:hypothetical protein
MTEESAQKLLSSLKAALPLIEDAREERRNDPRLCESFSLQAKAAREAIAKAEEEGALRTEAPRAGGQQRVETGDLFRKKPVVIEAVQWTTSNEEVIEKFINRGRWAVVGPHQDHIWIQTLEGTMTANPGDWIIKGVKGEFYPCKPDIFEATYEPASSQIQSSSHAAGGSKS